MVTKQTVQKKIKVTISEQELQLISAGVSGLRLGDSLDFGLKLRKISKAIENGQSEYIDDNVDES